MSVDAKRFVLTLFGLPQLTQQGEPVAIQRRKAWALLAYLAEADSPKSRDHLAALLWPDSDQEHARASLRRTLSFLRNLLGDAHFVASNERIAFDPQPDIWVDVLAFRQLLRQAHDHEPDAADCHTWLTQAAALYRGAFLDGLLLPDCAAFETWQQQTAEVFRQQATAVQNHTAVQNRLDSISPQFVTHAPSPFASIPLPTPLTPLMGQADTLAQVVAWLGSGNGRLLTITGMGGVGKTRLALEAARLAQGQFADGVVFVPLAQARSGAEALTAVAHATRCPLHADTPSWEQLHDHLRPRHLLLLLDNLEQLTGDAAWLEHLLLAAPSIICLATSRIPLRLPGEWLFPLAPMPYPAADDDPQAATYAAVQFFAHCARRAQPHFSLTANLAAVARICRLVAGLPLALELAAIWTRSLPCAQIAAALAQGYTCLTRTAASCDDDGRQHSIHNTLAWSWSLLPPAAQTALAQLALIHGSFTLAIAPAITGADPLTLAALVEHSLVQAGGDGRYHLHELTRRFAAARLAEQPEAAQQAGERHCAWYLAFLRQRAAALTGGAQGDAVRELVGELDNVRAAWQWAAQNDRDAVAGAMQPLFLFYKIRGLFAEGAADFHLALVGGRAVGALQTRLQVRLAFFYQQVDRLAEAWPLLQESLDICQRKGWVAETAVIHQTLGDMAWKRGASAAAATHYRASARACRQAGDHPGMANALSSFSNAVFDLGQTAAAAAYAQKSLRLRRQLGDWWGMAASLNNLSHIAEAQGNYAQATSLLQEGVTAAQHAGAAWLQGVLHRNLAHIQTLHVVGNGEW